MNTMNMREQLHTFLEMADDEKLNKIYIMLEDEINESNVEYTIGFKSELDDRVDNLINGGKTVSPIEMNNKLHSIRNKRK